MDWHFKCWIFMNLFVLILPFLVLDHSRILQSVSDECSLLGFRLMDLVQQELSFADQFSKLKVIYDKQNHATLLMDNSLIVLFIVLNIGFYLVNILYISGSVSFSYLIWLPYYCYLLTAVAILSLKEKGISVIPSISYVQCLSVIYKVLTNHKLTICSQITAYCICYI